MGLQREPRIQVRKVTDVHAVVTRAEPEADCTYAYQSILDNGAEERVWVLREGDADQIQDLLLAAEDTLYDTERHSLIFKDIDSD